MKPINIKNNQYGRLRVVEFVETRGKSRHAYWRCVCVCGNEKIVRASHLKTGSVSSCGCYASEVSSTLLHKYATSISHRGVGNPAFKHGETKTPLFKIYLGMLTRCTTASAGNYKRYGGRGIRNEWDSFMSFKTDMAMSYKAHVKKYGKKNTSLDRIDVNGNYSKQNCRWATPREQSNNRENNRYLIYRGTKRSAAEWARIVGLTSSAFLYRLKKMSISEAIETPILRKHVRK